MRKPFSAAGEGLTSAAGSLAGLAGVRRERPRHPCLWMAASSLVAFLMFESWNRIQRWMAEAGHRCHQQDPVAGSRADPDLGWSIRYRLYARAGYPSRQDLRGIARPQAAQDAPRRRGPQVESDGRCRRRAQARSGLRSVSP